jgi:predicted ATPase
MSDVHADCHNGRYKRSCKYGDPDCPAHFHLPELAREVLDNTRLFNAEDAPFHGRLYEGDGRLLVVVGENASGKSMLFRVISAHAKRDYKITGVTISIRERTGAGAHEMGGMRRMMMFGDENEQSTGATSVSVIETGFLNAAKDEDGKRMLMLDEPEIGLSDGYARALGELIGLRTIEGRYKHHGVVVVTHNRSLVSGLLKGFEAWPAFVHLGQETTDLQGWLAQVETRSVADLQRLRDDALARWRAVRVLMGKK